VPRDKSKSALSSKWIDFIQRYNEPNWTPRKYSYVCSNHFPAEAFDRTGQTIRLRADVAPSLCPTMNEKCGKKQLKHTVTEHNYCSTESLEMKKDKSTNTEHDISKQDDLIVRQRKTIKRLQRQLTRLKMRMERQRNRMLLSQKSVVRMRTKSSQFPESIKIRGPADIVQSKLRADLAGQNGFVHPCTASVNLRLSHVSSEQRVTNAVSSSQISQMPQRRRSTKRELWKSEHNYADKCRHSPVT